MILVEAGQQDAARFDAKLLLATALAARGHTPVLDDAHLPEGLARLRKYDAAPFLADVEDRRLSGLLLLGGEDISTPTLARLRRLDLPEAAPLAVIGTFPDHQSAVAAQTRVAYALGREPRLVDLGEALGGPAPGLAPLLAPVTASVAAAVAVPAPPAPRTRDDLPRLLVFLTDDWLDAPHIPPLLSALDNVPRFAFSVVLSAAGKDRLRQTHHAGLDLFAYADILPAALARQTDIAAFYGEGSPGERMAALAVELCAAGKVVIDCTGGSVLDGWGAPVLRGPEEPAALYSFLETTVLPNRAALGRAAADSRWIAARGIDRFEAMAGLPPPPAAAPTAAPAPETAPEGRIVFLPTNGSGLGHAQRCTRIAGALARPEAATFLAFPSCTPLIQSRGFPVLPLVQKSPAHPEDYANDLVNYLRLRRTLTARDHLVFDGGHVFESIFRTIVETGCRATWIRRGLWRPGQVTRAALDRERVFDHILVPEEAFPELNVDYSRGPRITRVGPIVETPAPEDRAALRARLAETFGHDFDTLVVSMLGGGMAADRTAQLHAVAGLLDPRPRCLHLGLVWPNARVAPGLGGWRNTRLVRTHHALPLMRAADAVVSAVGYNSFHEILYNRIPAILIPQVAAYLDDQERRARAASERGLAETVLAHELLLLDRRLADLLDHGGAGALGQRLAALDLPPPGTAEAARLIEEGTPP